MLLYGLTDRERVTEAALEAYPDRLYRRAMEFFLNDSDDAAASIKQIVESDQMLEVRIYAALDYDKILTIIDGHADRSLDDRLNLVIDAAGVRTPPCSFSRRLSNSRTWR